MHSEAFPNQDRDVVSSFPGLIDLTADLVDFEATAALVANLDLIITVDTAMGHLSGALGKPVWIMLPKASDWRWLLDRDNSPWYPTARLFRQPRPGEWGSVVEQVTHALAQRLRSDTAELAAE